VTAEVEFYVWDMGKDITLSCSFLEDFKLLPPAADEGDDDRLQTFVTETSGWEMSSQNWSTRAHLVGEVYEGAKDAAEMHAIVGGERATSGARDSWTLEKAMELRDKLAAEMKSPDPEVAKRLEDLATKYEAAFGTDITKPCNLRRFKVRLKSGANFVAMVPRRVSEPVLQEIKKQIGEMLEMGVIEPSNSAWAFPLVMVKRPGSSKLRMAVDYRLLNAQSEPYPYGMPDMNEVLDKLVGKRFYWSVDVSSYYWQIEMDEESRPLTAFVIPGGDKFQFTRVPFGLKSAPMWAQQQLRDELRQGEETKDLVNFLDDITYGSDDPDDLCNKFESLLKFCISKNIKLKREKCVLGVPAIRALGCVVNAQGKFVDPDRVLALLKLKPATNVKELRCLLGSFGFVRQWIAHSATTCAPLTDLLKKQAKFTWSTDQDRALEALKREVQLTGALGSVDPSLPLYIRPDSSNIGTAAVLFQMIKVTDEQGLEREIPRAIAYTSRRFSAAERRWTTAEAEAFGIKNAVTKFSPLIQGLQFIVECDHANHRYLYNATSAKIQRWRMYLEQFDYEIRHIAGKNQEVADGLSRLHLHNLLTTAPTSEEAAAERRKGIIAPSTLLEGVDAVLLKESEEEEGDPEVEEGNGEGGLDEDFFKALGAKATDNVSLPTLRTQQLKSIGDSTFEVEVGEVATANAAQASWEEEEKCGCCTCSHVRQQRKVHFEEEQRYATYGIGHKIIKSMGWRPDRNHDPVQVEAWNGRRGLGWETSRRQKETAVLNVVSDEIRAKLETVHNDRVGHVGKQRTYQRIRKLPGFPWGLHTEAVHESVKEWCDGCLTCQKVWSLRGEPGAPGAAIIRQRPFTEVNMDLITVTEEDDEGHRNILNITDSFSRFSELFALKQGDAASVAECLYAVYCRYGRPVRLRCDGAKAFHGAVLRRLNQWLGVQDHVTLAYSPFQNGQSERTNQEISRHLRAMVLGDTAGVNSVRHWGLLLPAVQRILNNTIHSDTGVTPNELIYGGYGDSEVSLFLDSGSEENRNELIEPSVYVKELEEASFNILCKSELHQEGRLAAVAERAAQQEQRELQAGDYVLARRGGLGGRPKGKLQSRYSGPWLVLDPRPDPSHSIVRVAHLATKAVEEFHMQELQRCNMSHFREAEQALPWAAKDEWTYLVDSIQDHRPHGQRRLTSGRLRPKEQYEFFVKYKLIPLSVEEGCENPSWQPWRFVSHLTALRDYCARPDVAAALGGNFYVGDD